MDKIKYRISLDMHSSVSQASLAAKQGDDNRQFSITLRSGGQPYKIERGAFAVFSTTLPDGKVIEDNCIIVDDEILYDFTQNLTSQVGVLNIEIRLYGPNSNLVTSPTFILVVSPRAAKAEEIESTNSFTSLDAMYNKLNGIANEVQTKLENGEFVGESGLDAGFGKVAAEAVSRSPGTPPTVTVETSGPNTAKNFNFTFGIPVPTSLDFKVDPVFANNSWETIAKVARYGDPSKYWKVGEYKAVGLSTVDYVSDVVEDELGEFWSEYSESIFMKWAKENEVGEGYFTVLTNYVDGTSGTQISTEIEQFKENPVDFHKAIINGEIDIEEAQKWMEENYVNRYLYYEWHITPLGKRVCVHYHKQEQVKEYPLQIIGFNHDKVTDSYNYGKQKAGMTLQLGASRNIYGDDKEALPIIPIDGIMTTDGYYKSPNSVKEDFSGGATNWVESGFRKAIQSIFDNTEIAPYIVSVQKLTSRYYKSNIYWSDTLISNDKVFLPSEYEMFGDQIVAPFKEGEQYEFYEDGYSKFMWSQVLLDSPVGTVIRLWLRSGYGKKVNEIKEDSNYSCNIYLSVNSFNPISVVYSPSYATGGNGMIAPCVCL